MATPQIIGNNTAESLTGGSGDDEMFGQGGDDTLRGGAGADYLQGGAGRDSLFGEEGDDTLEGLSGADTGDFMDGGPGNDSIYSAEFNDTLLGGDGLDTLIGGAGNDLLDGGADNDTLDAGAGNDTLVGGSGGDLMSGQNMAGDKSFIGGDGDDSIFGGTGKDTMDAGAGDDTINTGSGTTVVTAGDGDDTVAGVGTDTIDGGAGNDSIFSLAGNDSLSGGDGQDTIIGGPGDDTIGGGAGNDSLVGGDGADRLFGDAGNDTLSGQTFAGNKWLDGGAGDDVLFGGAGNDTLVGGNGNDQLYGGSGNDTYRIDGRTAYVLDEGGTDTAIVSADWVKLPSSIENVTYENARALPYWIDALLPGEANGMHFAALLGPSKAYKFAFATTAPTLDYDPFAVTDGNGFTPFNETQKAFARTVLSYVSSVVGITFEETSKIDAAATLVFGNNTGTPTVAGYAYYPNAAFIGSDVFLSKIEATNLAPQADNRAALVFIHEISHAIGLKHPFEQDGAAVTKLPAAEDSTAFTVMSYTEPASPTYQIAYSDFDLAALQYLYGPSAGARAGNDTYTLSTSKGNFIWDGAGTDAIDGGSLTQSLVLSLNPGDWSYIGSKANLISAAGQVTVNFGTSIENASGGSGADSITGNELANDLSGAGGNDTLLGGDGADSLSGGSGDDSLTGGTGNDTLAGGSGTDTSVYSGARAAYTITGDRNAATISGADGTDVLTGIEKALFTDGVFDLADPPPGTGITGKAYAWKGHQLLANVAVTATAALDGSQASATSNASGAFDLGSVVVGNHAIAATRAATDAGTAINSADALGTLRIAVGVNPNTDPDGAGPLAALKLSPYQLIAADANKDGKVNSADALAILRMAVNAPSAPAKEWLFVRENLDLWDGTAATGSSSLTRTASAWSNTAVAQGETVNLVGVLKGDVNGSWALQGSAKVEDTDPAYFANLAAALQVPTDIWGV